MKQPGPDTQNTTYMHTKIWLFLSAQKCLKITNLCILASHFR
jgi:hypothetical protein